MTHKAFSSGSTALVAVMWDSLYLLLMSCNTWTISQFSEPVLSAFISCSVCIHRYEDNGDAVNNLVVIAKQTGNKSIEDFGSPDKWLQDNAKLLGEDVWKGTVREQAYVHVWSARADGPIGCMT